MSASGQFLEKPTQCASLPLVLIELSKTSLSILSSSANCIWSEPQFSSQLMSGSRPGAESKTFVRSIHSMLFATPDPLGLSSVTSTNYIGSAGCFSSSCSVDCYSSFCAVLTFLFIFIVELFFLTLSSKENQAYFTIHAYDLQELWLPRSSQCGIVALQGIEMIL